ncbi:MULTISPECIES: hypothetical protein [unclassified Streptomyces]
MGSPATVSTAPGSVSQSSSAAVSHAGPEVWWKDGSPSSVRTRTR